MIELYHLRNISLVICFGVTEIELGLEERPPGEKRGRIESTSVERTAVFYSTFTP